MTEGGDDMAVCARDTASVRFDTASACCDTACDTTAWARPGRSAHAAWAMGVCTVHSTSFDLVLYSELLFESLFTRFSKNKIK